MTMNSSILNYFYTASLRAHGGLLDGFHFCLRSLPPFFIDTSRVVYEYMREQVDNRLYSTD